jgi:hypothetical protein
MLLPGSSPLPVVGIALLAGSGFEDLAGGLLISAFPPMTKNT